MDKMRLGGGGRYSKLAKQLAKEGADDPRALAAAIGMKKYGKKRFLSLAAKGRRRALRNKS